MCKVSIIIPAYNEGDMIEVTLAALVNSGSWFQEIIVVDDGSMDGTGKKAMAFTNQVIRLPYNRGKSTAVLAGVNFSRNKILLFLDADLGLSARLAQALLPPIQSGEADMSVAVLPEAGRGGLGLVKRWAQQGIYRQTGTWLRAPLSGQRALRKEQFLRTYRPDVGFGLEVGLTIDYLQAGHTIKEVEISFTHRERGKSLSGFWHRFKQGLAIKQAFKMRQVSSV